MRAVVIRTYGDQEIAGAIVDGMSRAVTPLNGDEYTALRAELARLRNIEARDAVRRYGDSVRFETACKALAVKYPPEHHGRLYHTILGAWAFIWLALIEWHEYVVAVSRGRRV